MGTVAMTQSWKDSGSHDGDSHGSPFGAQLHGGSHDGDSHGSPFGAQCRPAAIRFTNET